MLQTIEMKSNYINKVNQFKAIAKKMCMKALFWSSKMSMEK